MTTHTNLIPKQFQVKYLVTAAQEVKEIIRDIKTFHGATAAQKIRENLVTKTTELLSQSPNLGRILYEYPDYAQKGVRRYLPHPHYSILYLVNGNTVEVWHVFDNRRDWSTLFED